MTISKGGDKTRAMRAKTERSASSRGRRKGVVPVDAVPTEDSPTVCVGDGRRLVCVEGLVVTRLEPARTPASEAHRLSFHSLIHDGHQHRGPRGGGNF